MPLLAPRHLCPLHPPAARNFGYTGKTVPGIGQGRAGRRRRATDRWEDGAGHWTSRNTYLKGLSIQLAEGSTKSLAVDGGPRVRGLTPLVSLNARGG